MAPGSMGKIFAPVGLVLVLIGIVEAVLAFLIILLQLTGDFATRIQVMTGTTAVAFILGGASLTWLGRSG